MPGLPAEEGGLQAGDAIVSVAGVETRTDADYWSAADRLNRGQKTEVQVIREGESLTLIVVPGVAPAWSLVVANGLTAIAYLLVALLVLMQKGWDPRGRSLILFALAVALEFSLPQSGSSFFLQTASIAAFFFLTGVQFSLELHLAAWIPDRHPWLGKGPIPIVALYLVGLGLGLTAALAVVLEALGRETLPWTASQASNLIFVWVMPLWAILLVLLLGHQARRHASAEGRGQALLVLMGVTPWVVYVLSTVVAARVNPEWVQPTWLTLGIPLILLTYPVAVFVAIYRFRLFDIELVVRRSLVYGTLTTTLLLVFYALLGAGGALFSLWVDQEGHSVWVIALATLVLGLVFAPLRRWVQNVIDKRFFPERDAQRSQLIDLASELPALGQLPAMGRHLTEKIDDIFGIPSSTVLLADAATGVLATLASSAVELDTELDYSFLLAPEDPGVQLLRDADRPLPAELLGEKSPYLRHRLTTLGADLAVPISHQDHLVGVLLLGKKADGQDLRGEELELLSLLGHHVASVFENARLFESATYESLTGLFRREKILEQLEQEVHRAHRYRRPMTAGMADLDKFKDLNDSYGHLAGDTVLKRVAQVLANELRSTDVVGRYGGEEFLLLLPETDLDGGIVVAEKLREAIESTKIPLGGGRVIQVTISIGLASLEETEDGEPQTSRDLIENADRVLYQAKRAGRNRVLPSLSEDSEPT